MAALSFLIVIFHTFYMKHEPYEPSEVDYHEASKNLSSRQVAETFERLMDVTGLTAKELEMLKKSDIHFDDTGENSFSGTIDGVLYERIGSGHGKVDGKYISPDEEKSLFDLYEGIASIIWKSQEAKHEPWKTEDNSPTPPSFI